MRRLLAFSLVALAGCATTEDASTAESAITNGVESYSLEISPGVAASVDEAFIRREVEASIALYTHEIAPLSAPISVVVDAPDCLRTGYDMPTRKVLFCNNTDTPRAGTASADVIHHEVFHAMLCQTKPEWCDATASATSERTAIHEGLADFFAYTLAPDDVFGEGFYREQAFVRRYRESYCYSLVSGGHEKGNAIVSALIARGHGLAEVKRVAAGSDLTLDALFSTDEDPCFSANAPKVNRTAVGYPESTLERYRIRPNEPLTLAFDGDAAFEARYPNLTVRWSVTPTLFAIDNLSATSFRVTATGTDGYEKIAALFVVDGQVVGGKSFYFQVARAATP